MIMYTSKIQKAIDFAAAVHKGQKRREKGFPYIIHPLGVGLILARTGAGENVVIAGILHDTIEESREEEKSNVREFITHKFGKEVYRMVNDVTEQDRSLPWTERKRIALEHISYMKKDSLLVKSADVLYNMIELISHRRERGDRVFKKFHAPKEKQFKQYTNLIKTLRTAWSKNPLLPELEKNLKKLLRY